MAGFGEYLRQAREEKGFTLKDAQRVTKIRCRHLEALENEDLDAKLGTVYYRGFLRAYARFLDLDPEPLMEELEGMQPGRSATKEGESSPSVDKPTRPIRPRPSRSRPRRRPLQSGPSPFLTFVVLLLLLTAVYFLVIRPGDANEDIALPTPTGNDVGEVTPPPLTPDPTPPQEPQPLEAVRDDVSATRTNFYLAVDELELVLTVEPGDGNECWVRVVVDGNREFEGTLQPGSERSFSASQEIMMRVGKPWVLDMVLNEVQLGKAGVPGPAKNIYLWVGEPEE